jgi:CHASE2 domain-containing sensor protein
MDSWFSEEISRWFVFLAFLSFFSLLGPYALRGRRRRLVMTLWAILVVFGVACLGAAVTAWWMGQPGFVVRPLAVSGGVITVIFTAFYRTLTRAYQEAELRSMVAQDL